MNAPARRPSDLRFVHRIRLLRSLGLGLGFLCVAGVLREQPLQPVLWALLLLNGFAWPHLAYWLAMRSDNPQRAEMRNLVVDSASGGAWIAVMHFNLVPSALFVSMLSMDKVSVGGPRFLARTALAQLLACAGTAVLTGLRFEPASSTAEILACLPFMIVYPLAVASATYALQRKVAQQNRQLEELTRIDPLTGLLNHTHWEEVVLSELRRHQRLGRPAALLMLDIDSFKPINDAHGHPAGDEVLRGVAGVIGMCVRDIDVPGRYGGDEFGIVLPEADTAQACAVAERIRHSVQAASLGADGRLRCTVSVGLAPVSRDMKTSRDWIDRADQALYRAKSLGRNRVAIPA